VTSIGGSLTARLDKGRLSISDIHATDGFEEHHADHADRRSVVTFTSSTHRSEITVWLENGEIKSSVVETSETHSESAPVSSYVGGGGGGD
jgi:hypothetical protein